MGWGGGGGAIEEFVEGAIKAMCEDLAGVDAKAKAAPDGAAALLRPCCGRHGGSYGAGVGSHRIGGSGSTCSGSGFSSSICTSNMALTD